MSNSERKVTDLNLSLKVVGHSFQVELRISWTVGCTVEQGEYC